MLCCSRLCLPPELLIFPFLPASQPQFPVSPFIWIYLGFCQWEAVTGAWRVGARGHGHSSLSPWLCLLTALASLTVPLDLQFLLGDFVSGLSWYQPPPFLPPAWSDSGFPLLLISDCFAGSRLAPQLLHLVHPPSPCVNIPLF